MVTKEHQSNVFLKQICMVSFICMTVIVRALGFIGVGGIVRTGIMALLVYAPVLWVFISEHGKAPYDFFAVLGGVFLIYVLTLLIYPEYTHYISKEMWGSVATLYGGITGYLFIRLSNDPAVIRRVLLFSAFILFAAYFLQSVDAIRNGYWESVVEDSVKQSEYSMSFGYNMLFPSVVFMYYGLREKRSLLIGLSVVGGLEIFMLGSRAASVSLLFFVGLYLLFISARFTSRNSRVFIVLALALIIFLFVLFDKNILTFISGVFETIGFRSRTISRMLEGSFVSDAIRTDIWRRTWELISSNWLTGTGFLSDRYFIRNYCHNIVLELLLHFGFIAGGAAIIFIIYHTVKMLFRCKDADWLGLFLIFFTCCALRLVVSYSLWRDRNFWMAVGICVTYLKRQKKETRQLQREKDWDSNLL